MYNFLCQVDFFFWFPYQKFLCISVFTKNYTRPTLLVPLYIITPVLHLKIFRPWRSSLRNYLQFPVITCNVLKRTAVVTYKKLETLKKTCAVERRAARRTNIIFLTFHTQNNSVCPVSVTGHPVTLRHIPADKYPLIQRNLTLNRI